MRVAGTGVACAALAGCHGATASGHHDAATGASAPARAGVPNGPTERVAVQRVIRAGRPVFCGGAGKPYAAFTFDDGPGPYTPLALRILRHAHAPATFFLVGRNVVPYRASARREARAYALGDHTFTHPVLTTLPPVSIASEIERTSAIIRQQTGYSVDLFRPPYEAHDATVDATARRLGMAEILWNVDSGDSEGANWARIARNVKRGLSNGAIVLMHENRGQTIRALKFAILPALRRRHIHLVTVPELLRADPPSAAQLARGRGGCRFHRISGPGS